MDYPLNPYVDQEISGISALEEILQEYRIDYERDVKLDDAIAHFLIKTPACPLVIQVDKWDEADSQNYFKLLDYKKHTPIAILRYHESFVFFRTEKVASLIIWQLADLEIENHLDMDE